MWKPRPALHAYRGQRVTDGSRSTSEFRMSATRLLTLLATAAIVVAACSSSYASPAPVGGGATSAAGVVVGTASSPSFGTVLTGPNGMTLYTHAGDTATSSTCTGDCATAWPPLAATGQPMAGPGLTGKLGTATRPDGSTQVTYGGLPLYYWEGDKKAGDVTGNGIDGFAVATVGGAGAAPAASPAAPASSSPGGYSY
jgi:predicted lipoprotein with Yx(FWY)xxD motif